MDEETIRQIFNAGLISSTVEEHRRRLDRHEEAIGNLKLEQAKTGERFQTILDSIKENGSARLAWRIAVFSGVTAILGAIIGSWLFIVFK